MSLISELKKWREATAAREGVELYRVLPNAAVLEIAGTMPKTREELMSVKGIKEAKYRKYGKEILAIVHECHPEPVEGSLPNSEKESGILNTESIGEEHLASDPMHQSVVPETLSVGQFLDGLNLELSGMAARVQGEISSVDERERVVYFSLKDAADGSTLPCLIFRSAYVMSGVRLAVGDEVIVEGSPEIWKPMGKLSMKCGFIEYAGEGALKKAYDALFAKFSTEGLLAPERKREIPAFPTRIALLTSRDGAAIGDFMMNVGRHGYAIDLYASSVEGARAVPELLAGLRYFRKHADRYDVLVVIRGGGSLESLSAFNNETLVRAIAEFPIPVIAGIGHEKDVTLATLVADAGVSTPTAASRLVRQSWEEGAERVVRAEHTLRSRTADLLSGVRERLSVMDDSLLGHFQDMKERIRTIVDRFLLKRETLSYRLRTVSESIATSENGLKKAKGIMITGFVDRLSHIEALFKQFDPNRALALGYSLIRLGSGKILRKSTDAKVGDRLDIRLSEGTIDAEVKEVS